MLGHVRVFSSMAAGCAFSLLLQGIPDAIIIDSAINFDKCHRWFALLLLYQVFEAMISCTREIILLYEALFRPSYLRIIPDLRGAIALSKIPSKVREDKIAAVGHLLFTKCNTKVIQFHV